MRLRRPHPTGGTPVNVEAGGFKRRVEDEPVGFAANIRMTLLAVLAIAVFAGWRPDIEDAMATIVAVVAAVEAWTTWWARAAAGCAC